MNFMAELIVRDSRDESHRARALLVLISEDAEQALAKITVGEILRKMLMWWT